MFKRAKKPVEQPAAPAPAQPEKSAQELAQELETARVIARGERVKSLSAEAAMWRMFATGCEAGRCVREEVSMGIVQWQMGMMQHPRLSVSMDADTAPLWKEFALRMAVDRESRLRDVLSAV